MSANVFTYRLSARQYHRWTFVSGYLVEHARAHATEHGFSEWEIVSPDGDRLAGNNVEEAA